MKAELNDASPKNHISTGARQRQRQMLLMGLEKQYTQDTFSPPCVGCTQPVPLI